jgi:uncharacterized membrane protein YdfJ with MMPL/SSD domain
VFEALARLAHGRPKWVVVAAILLGVASGAIGGGVADRLTSYGADDPDSESIRAADRLREASGAQPAAGIVILVPRAESEEAADELRSERGIARVESNADGRDRSLLSEDGRTAAVLGFIEASADEDDVAAGVVEHFEGREGVTVGGSAVAFEEIGSTIEKDLQRAELLAFPLLFLLSFWFFRSLVAALLPLLVGGLSIILTFLGLTIATTQIDLSIFALNLVTGLGLGLAIDYSLFMVSRYREEIAVDGPGLPALARTMATAGRTVLFSSLTVAAALAALLIFPQRFLYSMGLGGMMVALIAAAVALVVLPAVLALLGERVNALAPRRLRRAAENEARREQAGFWYRLSRFVMRRPGRIAIASSLLLIVLGLPFLRIDWTDVNAEVLPSGEPAREVHQTLRNEFPLVPSAPLTVVVDGPADDRAQDLAARLRELPGIRNVTPAEPVDETLARIDVIPAAGELSGETQQLVRDIRSLDSPVPTAVTGTPAEFLDRKDSIAERLPWAIALIAAATLIVLFLMTGSLILPLKALLMNLLTLSATFGLLVLIFQDGRLEGLLDYEGQGGLELTQPLVLFAVAFGLSTDYGVFLLSRIKEARDSGLSNREAVATGLERTGRVVTAAALLFCVAIGAFATSEIIFIKQVGVGTALAVIIDATLVRALLVPSLMELLGNLNWWAPRLLRRIHQRFGVSESGGRAAAAG